MAHFYREPVGFRVRFAGTADFLIAPESISPVRIIPASDDATDAADVLYRNSILPLIANYNGGLFLHGSAVRIGTRAAAFLGVSRSGKTTLAGAFARAGHPFLTEDAVELDRQAGSYNVVPKPAPLRLFPDSAAHLTGVADADPRGAKAPVESTVELPACDLPTPLAALYLLGAGEADRIDIEPLSGAGALACFMQHAFVLDVEDRPRLAQHFGRLGELARSVPCRRLSYPRRFESLPAVVDAVVDDLAALCE